MRWQLSVVCATSRPGSLGAAGPNDVARAESIRHALATGAYEYAGEVSLWDALHPSAGSLFVGAHSDSVMICHAELTGALIHANAWSHASTGLRGDFIDTALGWYPDGEVMALAVNCVTSLWGFSAYRQGQRVRAVAASLADGVFADNGNPLPEESSVLARGAPEQLNAQGAGEDLVLAASSRMFGYRIDGLPGTGPVLSHYRRRSSGA